MSKYLLDKLKDTRGVTFYSIDRDEIAKDNIAEHTNFLIERNHIDTTKDILFIFEDYMVKPFNNFDFNIKFNNGKDIPFNRMVGRIERDTGKMYFISVHGILEKVNSCEHCFKKGECMTICAKCKTTLYGNIDLSKVVWKGYVPKKSIISMENV